MDVRLLQLKKAIAPMEVTLLGIVMEVRPLHLKAALPMEVMLLGIVMEVSSQQFSKASLLMEVTEY